MPLGEASSGSANNEAAAEAIPNKRKRGSDPQEKRPPTKRAAKAPGPV